MKPILTHTQLIAPALVVVITVLSVHTASAAGLNWNADTVVALTSPAITLTISSGSGASDLVVNSGNIVVTVQASGHFSISSADRRLIATGGSPTTACNSGTSTITIDTGGAPQTVTITPDSAQCTAPSGGGGGGGGFPAVPTPTPPPVRPHPDGTLVLEGTTAYLIANGMRSGFRNPDEYLSYGYNFSQLVQSNAADNSKPYTGIQKAMEGTLVLDAADSRTVYMVGENGSRRGFVSEAVFAKLGYSLAGIPKMNLSDYVTGAPIADASQSHPEGALVLDGQTVWWIRGNARQGFESEAVFRTYGFTFDRVVKANDADRTFTVGPGVRFRDGTLVRDGGNYYIISDGKKLAFSSSEDLVGRGYKLSNVIVAALTAYESGGALP